MAGIKDYSTTAANNNDAPPNGFPEGMAPSDVNNSARQVMADIRSWYEDAQWIDLGNTPTYVSTSSFTIPGNVTAQYSTGRRIRCTDSTTLYGVISSSSYSAPNTTVNVTLDSGSLSVSLSAVAVGILTATGGASLPVVTVPFTPASSSSPAYMDFAEDTDNGTNRMRFRAPPSLSADTEVTGPSYTATLIGTLDIKAQANGRLTLTSGVPVTTTDVTGATTIYYTPYIGNQIGLYTGSAWVSYTFTELSLALGTLTSALPYDVFLDYNGGTPQLAILAWTNDTTRATALTLQDGVLVKTGDTEQRYLGTFYTTSTTATEDSAHQRYLWNYYNRVSRSLKRVDPSSTWNYTTLTIRQANASADNEVRFVRGIDEDIVFCSLQGIASNSSANIAIILGIGLDSTIAADTNATIGLINTPGAGGRGQICAYYSGLPGIGKHRLTWLEASQASGTTTWNGDNTGLPAKSGMFGHLLA